jgi:sterol O-acyltransferase
METADETASSVAIATGIETGSDAQPPVLRPKLGSRTITDPKYEDHTRIGAIMTIIDHPIDGVDESTVQIFREVIQSELEAIETELNGKAKDPSKRYPHNLTIVNWLDFIVLPTLVYELEYPRRAHIDWWYVAEKTAATLGGIWIMIIVSQSFMYTSILNAVDMKESGVPFNQRLAEFPWLVSDLLFPMLLEQLLTW